MKKITAFLLTAMCAVTTACGESTAAPANAPGKTAAASAAPASGAENEPIVFAMPVTAVVEGIKQVETEINNILESRIHTVVKLEPISLADYNSQVGLMMSSGDQIDVVTVLGTFSQLISKNQLAPMNAYLEPYGAGAAQALGEKFLKAATVNGSVYAFPTINGKAAALSIVLRKDMLEANNISLDHLTLAKNFKEYTDNLDALADVFAKLKAADPDKVMLTPLAAGNLVFPTALPGLDTLGDVYGVLGKDGATVTNFFEMDEYKTLLGYAHDWYEKGYVLQDAATTSEASNTFLSSGRTAGYFIVGEEGQAEQITTATGVDVAVVKILNPTITTTTINSLGFGIASTSKKPEAAMQFLNEMYTNADIVNLLDWGIEGVHYVKNADGTVGFPEGVDANNTTYGLNEDWLFGNQFLSYIWGEGRDTTIYGRLKANNDIAQYSPALGFTYDSAPVRNELTAAINVFNQYGPGLETGTVDPETELPKLIDALKTAGIDKIIAEKQRQLDAWKAAGN